MWTTFKEITPTIISICAKAPPIIKECPWYLSLENFIQHLKKWDEKILNKPIAELRTDVKIYTGKSKDFQVQEVIEKKYIVKVEAA